MKNSISFLTQEETKRLFATIPTKPDRALFLTTYRHGLRASEIGMLQRTDVDLKRGRITIQRLKGSLSGIYPMQPDEQKIIRSYLASRKDESPYLFVSNRGVPINRRTLWVLMRDYAHRVVSGVSSERENSAYSAPIRVRVRGLTLREGVL